MVSDGSEGDGLVALPRSRRSILQSEFDFRGLRLAYAAGTISSSDQFQFQRLIFRSTRGKVLCYFFDKNFSIVTADQQKQERTVYVLVF